MRPTLVAAKLLVISNVYGLARRCFTGSHVMICDGSFDNQQLPFPSLAHNFSDKSILMIPERQGESQCVQPAVTYLLASGSCQEYKIESGESLFLLDFALYGDVQLPMNLLQRPRKLDNKSLLLSAVKQSHMKDLDSYLATYWPNVKRELLVMLEPQKSASSSSSALTIQANSQLSSAHSISASDIDGDLFWRLLCQLSGASDISSSNGTLIRLRTRYSYSVLHSESADYLTRYFQSLGLEVAAPTYRLEDLSPFPNHYRTKDTGTEKEDSSAPLINVISRLKGTELPEEWIIIGAHFDCTSERPLELAPGAVDDGSGTVAVMTLANALVTKFGAQRRSIIFCTFSGEEQGLLGSKAFVQRLQSGKWNPFDQDDSLSRKPPKIVAAILMDMISYSRRSFGVKIEGTPDFRIRGLMNQLAESFKAQAPQLKVEQSQRSFGSDHVSFQRAGYPAVLLIEADDTAYPNYHRTTDIADQVNINLNQSVAIMRGLLHTVLNYSN